MAEIKNNPFDVKWLEDEGSKYHWLREDLPLIYQFSPETGAHHREAWEHGVGEWEDGTGLSLFRPVRVSDDKCHLLIGTADLYDITADAQDFGGPISGGGLGRPIIMDRVRHDTPDGDSRGLEYVLHTLSEDDPERIVACSILLDCETDEGTLRELCGHAQGHVLGLDHNGIRPFRIMSPIVDGSRKPTRAECRAIRMVYGG